jgi:hypothetical protein
VYYNLAVSTGGTTTTVKAEAPRGFFRVLWRAGRQLFHEATGAIFGVFALAATTSAVRSWESGVPRWMVALPLVYAAMMVYFSVTSFRSARRVR